jgi:general secretion pathway protein G
MKNVVKNSNRGFTLLEILLVLALLAGIVAIFGRNLFGSFGRGQVQTTKLQIKQLESNLDMYRFECGRYPTTEQTLEALISQPKSTPECKNYNPEGYLDGKKKVPTDSWGNPFKYKSDSAQSYEITSLGSDGAEGGEGNAKDISSKDE